MLLIDVCIYDNKLSVATARMSSSKFSFGVEIFSPAHVLRVSNYNLHRIVFVKQIILVLA